MAEKKRAGRARFMILAAMIVLLAAGGLYYFAPRPNGTDEEESPAFAFAAANPAATRSPDGAIPILRGEGETFFPKKSDWVYHFTFAYPVLQGGSLTVAKINDTYREGLNEMIRLVQPMFADSEDMRFDGKNEVTLDYTVTCNSDRLLSVVQRRTQSKGEEGTVVALETQNFRTAGDLMGDTITLRGAALVLAGADPAALDDVQAADYPQIARIIGSSSDEMSDALLIRLYPEFQALQASGVLGGEWTREDYEAEFIPSESFYINGEGRIVFFFPPMMMNAPSFDPPAFSFMPEELDAMLDTVQ